MRVLILLLLTALSVQAANPTFTKAVDTVADMKALLVSDKHDTVTVRGYLTVNDGGQGIFELDPLEVAAADNGILFAPNAGNGRWKRMVTGRDYFARWWGPDRTNSTLQRAIDWVSANGHGSVTCDGGIWILDSDDSNRILMKSGVTLRTAEDSQLICAPNPADNWILIDFPLDVTNCAVGPARLVGWNLTPPGGDTNKTGVIFSLQDTVNVTIGGVRADNWYTQYADIGSGNQNLQMFDQDWQPGAMAHGAKGDGVTDDRRNLQAFAYFCERYKTEFYMRPTTNGYVIGGTGESTSGGVYFTNGYPVKIRGDRTLIKQVYWNPDEGTLQRYSAAFQIYSHNCSVEGFDFTTVGPSPATETNVAVTGFFIPIVTHMATNVVIRHNTFDVPTGKGILFTGGSYGQILENTFDDCGITYGNGHQPDWRFYEGVVPTSVGSFSPRGMVIRGNTFNRGTPYKTQLFLSACDDFIVSGNYFVDMNTYAAPLIIYTGDQGTTDELGTNIYKVSGLISGNFISGNNFGSEGAIQIRLNTPTNFVPASFDPDLMYSAITVRDNIIEGTGTGYNIQNGTGTKIIGGDCRTTGTSLALFGDSYGMEIDGGYYKTDGAGSLKSSILFGNAFLAVTPGIKNVKIKNCTFEVGPGCEYWMRNVLPITVDSITVENCDINFLGAAGAGDAPKIFQFQQCTNFISFFDNTFFVTNSMSGRSIGLLEGTNCDFNIVNNNVVILGDAIPRGLQVGGRTIKYHQNDLKTFEVQRAEEVIITDSLITYGDGNPPLEIFSANFAVVDHNRIRHDNTNSAVAVTIHATNSIFKHNIVRGNSGSDIVRAITNGTMYAGHNLIVNSGGGSTKPNAIDAAIVRARSWFDDPLEVVTTGAPTADVASFSRAGAGARLSLKQDGIFQTFTRDTWFEPNPTVATDGAGWAVMLQHVGGVKEFAFGADPTVEGAVRVGTYTNLIHLMLGNIMFTWGSGAPNGVVAAPTPSLYFDTNATTGLLMWIKTNGIGDTDWSPIH